MRIHYTDWTAGAFGSNSTGAAGTNTGGGDGWLDVAGSVVSAGPNNKLLLTNPAGDPLAAHRYALRPLYEAARDVAVEVRYSLSADGNVDRYIVLRHTGTGTEYLLGYIASTTSMYVLRNVAGTITTIGSNVAVATPTTTDVLRLTARAIGTTSVALTLTLYNETTGAVIATVTCTDASPPAALQAAGQTGLINGAASTAMGIRTCGVYDYGQIQNQASLSFTRYGSSPVIALGSTYGGKQADALAAPCVCRDTVNSRWAMLCDIWNVADSKWYNAAFTSTDLVTWSYVASSLQTPAAGKYIKGNGGIVFNSGDSKFYRTYSTYASAGTPVGIFLASSPDLVTWTDLNSGTAILTVGAAGSGDDTSLFDSNLVWNPNTSKWEIWYCSTDTLITGRVIKYATSATLGTTWLKQPIQVYGSEAAWAFATANIGEPCPFYVGTDRYLMFDSAQVWGARQSGLAYCRASGNDYTPLNNVLQATYANTWENFQVFDAFCLGLIDRGDGLGSRLWMLYAGGDVLSAADATHSGIGLAQTSLSSAGVVGGGAYGFAG